MEKIIENKTVIHRWVETANASLINEKDFKGYIPYCSPIIAHQKLPREHVVSRAPTQLSYIETSASVKEVDAWKNWLWNKRVKRAFDLHFCVILVVEKRDTLDDPTQIK